MIITSHSPEVRLPHIRPVGNKWLLHVHDRPMLILSGHVMNSTSFSPALMAAIWPRMKAFHLNTLMVPISWQAVEFIEGAFDFSLVDSLISQAREQEMHLVFAWFGTWKNGRSSYAPPWVKSDLPRFRRMQSREGRRLEVLSNLCEETLAADSRAFAAFMGHLQKVDSEQNTVLMVQVQNEVGLLGDTRDRSPAAEAAFADSVPTVLMDYLVKNKDRLHDHMHKVWDGHGGQTSGTWSEVFGDGRDAEEIFMAWHYARFIDQIAAAGQAAYPLPMFVNAWLGQEKENPPGKIPSGGPVARVMDVWKAAASHLDFLAPDIYAFYSKRLSEFSRDDNPVLVPEATALWLGDIWSAPAKAFYTIGEAQAMGFAPFAIDHELYTADHPIGAAYGALENLSPLLIQHFGTDNLCAFFREEENETVALRTLGPYQFHITYQPLLDQCYGLIIRIGEDEFIMAGNGLRIRFSPSDDNKHSGLSVLFVEKGKIGENGTFEREQLVGGDEVVGSIGVKLPAQGYDLTQDRRNMTILRVKMFLHPPSSEGTTQELDDTPEF